MGTFCRLARDEAVPAVVARLVDVEKGDGVAFLDRVTVYVREPATGPFDHTNRHVAGNDWKWNIELSAMEMHVGAAHL